MFHLHFIGCLDCISWNPAVDGVYFQLNWRNVLTFLCFRFYIFTLYFYSVFSFDFIFSFCLIFSFCFIFSFSIIFLFSFIFSFYFVFSFYFIFSFCFIFPIYFLFSFYIESILLDTPISSNKWKEENFRTSRRGKFNRHEFADNIISSSSVIRSVHSECMGVICAITNKSSLITGII